MANPSAVTAPEMSETVVEQSKAELYSWVADASAPASAIPQAAITRLVTPDLTTRNQEIEMDWLRIRSTEGRLPDATEAARVLALLTPVITSQRAALASWRTFEIQSARTNGLVADKITAFHAALEERQIAPVARELLAQLEWVRFLILLLHQVPNAWAVVNMSTMHTINDFIETVDDDQLDAVVGALPHQEVQYFCTEEASPTALRRVLDSLLRQPPTPSEQSVDGKSESATATAPFTTLVDVVKHFGARCEATDQTLLYIHSLLDHAREYRSLRALIGHDGDVDPMTARLDVLIEFVQQRLAPALSRSMHRLSVAHVDVARLAVVYMPDGQMPE